MTIRHIELSNVRHICQAGLDNAPHVSICSSVGIESYWQPEGCEFDSRQ